VINRGRRPPPDRQLTQKQSNIQLIASFAPSKKQ
jgi:hypothetical protein